MKTTKKRRTQEIEFRAAGMTLAQVKRSTARNSGGNTGLIAATVSLFALAAITGGYLALSQSGSPVDVAINIPVTETPDTTPVDVISAPLIERVALVSDVVTAPIFEVRAEPAPEAAEPIAELVVAEPADVAEPTDVAELADVAEIPSAAPEVFANPTDCIQTLDATAASLVVPFEPYATQADLTSLAPLVDLATALGTCDGAYIVVAGHADPSGDETQNLLLSWQRAEFVISAMRAEGFDANLFEAVGFGSRRPMSEGDSGGDDILNRRVDFIVRAAQP